MNFEYAYAHTHKHMNTQIHRLLRIKYIAQKEGRQLPGSKLNC